MLNDIICFYLRRDLSETRTRRLESDVLRLSNSCFCVSRPPYSKNRLAALKIVKSAPHYTETALDEIKLLERVVTANPESLNRQAVVELYDWFKIRGTNGTRMCLIVVRRLWLLISFFQLPKTSSWRLNPSGRICLPLFDPTITVGSRYQLSRESRNKC